MMLGQIRRTVVCRSVAVGNPEQNPEHFVLFCFVCTLYTSLHQTSQLGIFWAGGGAMWHLHGLRERCPSTRLFFAWNSGVFFGFLLFSACLESRYTRPFLLLYLPDQTSSFPLFFERLRRRTRCGLVDYVRCCS